MLNSIVLGTDNSIKFEFYDAQTGIDTDNLLCKGISLFKYSSSLSLGEESLPHFVLDVTCEKINKNNISSYLKNNKYSFNQQDGEPTVYEKDFYYIFRIQGGAIDIIVICQEIKKTICDYSS